MNHENYMNHEKIISNEEEIKNIIHTDEDLQTHINDFKKIIRKMEEKIEAKSFDDKYEKMKDQQKEIHDEIMRILKAKHKIPDDYRDFVRITIINDMLTEAA